MARDLDAAAANWKKLGFTISPRGTHSAHMGTGNYTIMLDPDYIELLGVLTETEHNAPARAFLANREGVERVAFTAVDSAEGAEEIRARGFEPIGPNRFRTPGDDAGRQPVGGEISHVSMAGSGSAGRVADFRLPAQDAGNRLDSRTDETRQRRQAPQAGADRLTRTGQGRRAYGAADRRQHQDGAGRRYRGAFGRRPRRFCLSHEGATGQALPGSFVRRIARTRQRRPRDRNLRSCGCGEIDRKRRLFAAPEQSVFRPPRPTARCWRLSARKALSTSLRANVRPAHLLRNDAHAFRDVFSLSRMLPKIPFGRKMMNTTSSTP